MIDGQTGGRPSRRVLFVNGAFPPERGATGDLLAELAARLAGRGWAVEVVTGPSAGAPAETDVSAGVRVFRPGGADAPAGPGRPSVARRALALARSAPRLLALALRRSRTRPDVVVTMTDPPLGFVVGPWLGRAAGAPVVHWAQDLYPDVAEALGVLPSGVAARALRRLARGALARHDHVVVVGRCMRDRLAEQGLRPERLTVVPNWAPAVVCPIAHAENPFRREHGLDGRFVVMYSGNLGLAHPFGAVLAAAERLAGSDPAVLFLFVGDGPRRPWVEAEAGRRGLGNVRFLPYQPRERLAQSLSAADLHLAAMEANLSGLVVPSKVYGALAAGRPVLFVGPEDSEAARLVREHACGTVLSALADGDPSAEAALGGALAAAVRRWAADPAAAAAAGARASAAAPAGPDTAAAAFEQVLHSVLAEAGPRN